MGKIFKGTTTTAANRKQTINWKLRNKKVIEAEIKRRVSKLYKNDVITELQMSFDMESVISEYYQLENDKMDLEMEIDELKNELVRLKRKQGYEFEKCISKLSMGLGLVFGIGIVLFWNRY